MATVYLAQPDKTLLQVIRSALGDNTTPLYQVLIWIWFHVFGFNEYAGRSLSAVIGTGSVVAMYFLAKEYINTRAGIIAAIITCTSQYLIYFSQEARSYQLLFLLTTLSLLFLSRLLRTKKRREFFIYTFFSVCLVQTHYYGILLYLAQAGLMLFHIFARESHDSTLIKRVLINCGITILSLLPAIPYLAKNAMRKNTWVPVPGPDFLIDYFIDYFANSEFAMFFFILCVAGLFASFKTTRIRQKNILVLALLSVLFVYILPYIRSLLDTPMLRPKYTIGMLPVIILLACAGLEIFSYRKTRVFLVLFLTLFSLYLLFVDNGYYQTIRKEQYREALDYIADNSEDPVIYYQHRSLKPYSSMLGYDFDIRRASHVSLEDIRNRRESFWLILRHDRKFDWGSWLDDKFQLAGEKNFTVVKNIKKHKIRVLRYDYSPDPGHTGAIPAP